jgi:hypothetical protein
VIYRTGSTQLISTEGVSEDMARNSTNLRMVSSDEPITCWDTARKNDATDDNDVAILDGVNGVPSGIVCDHRQSLPLLQ